MDKEVKNPLRAQSKYGLMGSSAKIANFFIGGSQQHFLDGLSLHLNHLIASHIANYNWPFGTLPFGLFGSNLDTRDLETYPRTYSGYF